MPVVYLNFEISFHGLSITRQEDIDAIKMKLDAAAREIHPDFPNTRLDNDVDVELIEHAGNID